MIDKFVGKYLLYVKEEVTANKLVENLGKDSHELGKFVNESKKTELRIHATRLLKTKYSNPDKKPIIDRAINKIKESPIPPETDEWKTFNSYENKIKYGLKCVGLNIENNDNQLIYLYYQYKSKLNDVEYNVVRVILTDYGNPEKFNSLQVDIENMKMDSKLNRMKMFSNSIIQKDKLMSSKKYQRRYPYTTGMKSSDNYYSDFVMNATPQKLKEFYLPEFFDILNKYCPNRDNKEDIIEALKEYREIEHDIYMKSKRNKNVEDIIKNNDDKYLEKSYGCELVHVLKKYNLDKKNREDVRYALEKAEELAKLIDIEIEADELMEKDIQELEEIYSQWFLDKVARYCPDWSDRENLINAITRAKKERDEELLLLEPEDEEEPKDWDELTKEEQDEIRSWSEHANLEWDEKKQEWFDPYVENRNSDDYLLGYYDYDGWHPGDPYNRNVEDSNNADNEE